MKKFGIAVKSFIIDEEGKLLLIKRRDDNVHSPGAWEIPGGRLDLGEDPFEGLKRETKEETGLEIEILNPLAVKHFTRDDGQKITMITFLCRPVSKSVNLSEEHIEYIWSDLEESLVKLHPAFHKEVDIIKKRFLNS
ncbi:NUDIX domain-containing protein [Candidatus Woesearchaeota archaeon]|nr:NUDIX domain-containing protein [Candidatus Woesearchaeota archaeon]